MRIAYVNTDEVNQDLASRMAAKCGAVVSVVLPADPPPGGLFDAVLYNLDNLPRDRRAALVEGLRRVKPVHPTAVHGYDISDEQAEALNQNGVAAARRLHHDLLRELLNGDREGRTAVPKDAARADRTWVNLAK
jgi:hypothetical protein